MGAYGKSPTEDIYVRELRTPVSSHTFHVCKAVPPRSDGGRTAKIQLAELSADEVRAIEQAQVDGYMIRSGRRLVVLAEWRRHCRATGWPCIIGIRGARHGIVEVDDVEIARVDADQLEAEAAKVASQNARSVKPSLPFRSFLGNDGQGHHPADDHATAGREMALPGILEGAG